MRKIKLVLFISFTLLSLSSLSYCWFAGYITAKNPSWTFDSKMVVFEEDSALEGNEGLRYDVVARNIGDNKNIKLTCDCREFIVSPDAAHVLINRSLIYDCLRPAGLWEFIPNDYLGNDTVVRNAVWSPDGGKIAYVRYNNTTDKNHICVFDLKKKTTKVILKDKFAFGPGGRDVFAWVKNRIIFTTASKSMRAKHEGIVLCSVDPNGAAVQYLPDQDLKIFMNKTAGEIKTKYGVFYQRKEGGKPEVTSLIFKDKKGGSRMLVPGNGSEPVCSPDSKTVVFVMQGNDGPNIWAYNIDKGVFLQLSYEGGEKPAWSKDGKRIAFIRGKNWFVIDANGANIRKTGTGEMPEFPGINSSREKASSPDGKYIAFIRPGTTGNFKEYPWYELVVTDRTGQK